MSWYQLSAWCNAPPSTQQLHLPCPRCPGPPAATSVEKLVQELTLLGFVSLLLTTFAKPLSKMCGEWRAQAMLGTDTRRGLNCSCL